MLEPGNCWSFDLKKINSNTKAFQVFGGPNTSATLCPLLNVITLFDKHNMEHLWTVVCCTSHICWGGRIAGGGGKSKWRICSQVLWQLGFQVQFFQYFQFASKREIGSIEYRFLPLPWFQQEYLRVLQRKNSLHFCKCCSQNAFIYNMVVMSIDSNLGLPLPRRMIWVQMISFFLDSAPSSVKWIS